MFNNIAVAFEDTPESSHALVRAVELAKALKRPLTTLTVVDPLPAYTAFSMVSGGTALQMLEQDRAAYYEHLKGRINAQVVEQGIEVSVQILDGGKVQSIVDFVGQNGIDLLVVGLHRRTLRVSSLWSTVYSLAQELPCSVLGVH